MNVFPDIAGNLFDLAEQNAAERFNRYKKLAEHGLF